MKKDTPGRPLVIDGKLPNLKLYLIRDGKRYRHKLIGSGQRWLAFCHRPNDIFSEATCGMREVSKLGLNQASNFIIVQPIPVKLGTNITVYRIYNHAEMSAIALTMWEVGLFEYLAHYLQFCSVAPNKCLGPKRQDFLTTMYIRVSNLVNVQKSLFSKFENFSEKKTLNAYSSKTASVVARSVTKK